MSHYVFPSIISLPRGYHCAVPVLPHEIAGRLSGLGGSVKLTFSVTREGEQISSEERHLNFAKGKLEDGNVSPFLWREPGEVQSQHHAYGELACESANGGPLFRSKEPFSMYSVYFMDGKKEFFSDNAYKYGSPTIIDQMAEFGQFVETYPVIDIDQDRDMGESLALINPYTRPINVRVITYDKRELKKAQVPARSCRHLDLAQILEPGERAWAGQLQLTASNRLIVFHIKHSARDPRIISDHEHMDPYRAEPTHRPLTLFLRTVPGKWVSSVKGFARRLQS